MKSAYVWIAVALFAGAAGALAQTTTTPPPPPLPGAVTAPAAPSAAPANDAGALVPALPSATLTPPPANQAPAAAARASASDIDALLPPQAQKSAPAVPEAAKQAAQADAPAPTPIAPAAPIAPILPANTAAAPGSIAPSVSVPPSLPPVPEDVGGSALSQVAPVDVTAGPKKPMTLEEEAAAMGIAKPQIGLPPLPDATAQALLSGQPLGEYEDETPLPVPQKKKKRKPSWRDLPKLKSSIPPLNRGYNYRRTLLPPSIYRKEYTAENKHLPVATYREDYERHLFGAVAANDINATRAFLNRDMDVNMTNARGETLLLTAIRYRAFDTARLLLARGADPRSGGQTGFSPRQLAESTGQTALVMALAARGG